MIVNSIPQNGYDAWVTSASTHTPHGTSPGIQVQGTTILGFLWLPITRLALGKTITSATLTGHARGATLAQVLTFAPVASRWGADTVTFTNKPGTTGSSTAQAIGALTDGQEFSIDFTALVQQVASGMAHFGWKITTSVTASVQKFQSFNSGQLSWTLTIEFAETPQPPSDPAPNGTAVGAAKPVVAWNDTDYGGVDTGITAARVQADIGNNGSIDWDSGFLATTVPMMDLAAAGMTGSVTSGTVVAWRVAIQDDDGTPSDFSDWATYTYEPLPTLTLDSPAAGVLYDPTSDVLAHISTSLLDSYRVRVTDGNDRTSIRYDSKKQQGTDPSNIAAALPLRNDDGSRIFTDDLAYQINVRAWDTYNRQSTPGVKSYVELWTTVTFNDDASPTVTSLHAAQVGATPFVQLTWVDSAAADAYLISRDDVHIARLTAADLIAGVSSYAWVDYSATPQVQHVYAVRRITAGVGRSAPKKTSIRVFPEGVWLLRNTGDYVVLDDVGVDGLATLERWLTYKPANIQYEVGILTSYEGISGPLALSVETAEDQTVAHALGVLDDIKSAPMTPVRLVYAEVSKPVLVRNLSALPHPDWDNDNRKHSVNLTVTQCGEFDHRLDSGVNIGGVAGVS